ncbi:MAG: SDR family oxidoreductase [Deltaproteobacteria bacterium]
MSERAPSAEAAIVLGATGLTGRFVVSHLVRAGVRTIAHVRPDSPRLREWAERFERDGAELSSAAWQKDAIDALVARERPTLVFGLLGTTQARAREATREGRDAAKETYEAVDVALTEMAIDACRATSDEARPRFVYLSSVGTGDSAAGSYLQARAKVERTLRTSGVPYTIARPSFIVGERDSPRALEKMSAPVVDGLLGALGALGAKALRERYRSISGEDLARALVAIARDRAWENRVAEPADLQAAARRASTAANR